MAPEHGDPTIIGAAFGSIEIDVYEITPVADGDLTVTLAFDQLGGDVDLDFVLRDAPPGGDPGPILSTDGATVSDPETTTIPVTAGQPIFISLHSYGLPAASDGFYTLTTTLQ